MTATVDWPLGNGQVLGFKVYERNTGWYDVPGLYIFSYAIAEIWYALYVGQVESFLKRLPKHERLSEAVRMGATHIHAMVVHEQSLRDEWERMLIRNLQPPLNIHYRNAVAN